MNQNTKLALVIGGIVSAVAGLTTLGVVYARFEQAQKTVKQTTLEDLLREKKLKMEHEDDIEADAEDTEEAPDEVIIETPVEPQAKTEEVKVPVLTVVKKAKSEKKGAPKND